MSFPVDRKQRFEYIDCVKGVAILCITFLHFENGVIPQWLNTWIGMFMITAFYVTSGWVFGLKSKLESPGVLFKKRLRQLGIPYFWFAVLIIIFDIIWVLCGFMEPLIVARELYKWVTLRGIGTLWFLPVLMFGEMLFCFVMSSQHPKISGLVLFVITLAISYFYFDIWCTYYRNRSSIFQLIDSPIKPVAMSLVAWPIIWTGYFISRNYNKYFTEANRYRLVVIGSLIILISLWLVIVPPFNLYYVNGFLLNTLPALGLLCLFVLIGTTCVGKFFGYWGKNSLIMMCLHFSILYEVVLVVDKYIIGHDIFYGWSTILYFCIIVIIMYPLVHLFNGRLCFMLGKSKKSGR